MYSNCGRVGEGGLIVSPSTGIVAQDVDAAQCEAELKDAYGKTYFPFLRNTCNGCHSSAHGSNDVDTSYTSFKQTGQDKINYQATHAHGGNSFGPANQTEINKFAQQWSDAQEAWTACMAKAGRTE